MLLIKRITQIVLLTTLMYSVKGDSIPCASRRTADGEVCVCNATYCDTVDRISHINTGEYVLFISSKAGLRFDKSKGYFMPVNTTCDSVASKNISETHNIKLALNTSEVYQKLTGFGGAFTDSTGINILSLSNQTQEHLLRSYFSGQGIEYNLCRLPIGGSDFSTRPYTYDDVSSDPQLQHFSLAEEDLKYKIPLIQRAEKMSTKYIHLVAAPWSPPLWMKSNHNFYGYSHLHDDFYDIYAKYLIRFLEEYKKHEINIWAISTGNEPIDGIIAITKINSLGWMPYSLTDWIVNYFGPQLRQSAFKNTKILSFDDQRLFLPMYIDLMVKKDKRVLDYVDGFGIHFYLDFLVGDEVVKKLHEHYPQKFLLYTEASQGADPWQKKVLLGSWERGQDYLSNILQNLNAWVTGWIDWNMALDMEGGPNWIGNFVDSPIIVNAAADEFYKQPMFYALGHVSKFIKRDAQRVMISPTDTDGVQATAVRNPDNTVVIVLLNKNAHHVQTSITTDGTAEIVVVLPAHSFATIVY